MKLQTLIRTKIGKILVLASLSLPVLQLTTPYVALAEAVTEKPSTTFEIKIQNYNLKNALNNLTISTTEVKTTNVESLTSSAVTTEEQAKIDELNKRKELLRNYFTNVRPSKFVNSVDTLAEQPHWNKVIAIAFVESTLGKRCYRENNCWGISPGGKLAVYKSLDEGIKAHNDLIARRYAEKTYQQMNCVYVVPCNPRWVKGTLQIEAELDAHVRSQMSL